MQITEATAKHMRDRFTQRAIANPFGPAAVIILERMAKQFTQDQPEQGE